MKEKIGNWIWIIATMLLMVFIMTCLRVVYTDGSSMEPTYHPGDLLICVRSFTPPESGTVVLIEHDSKLIIKRVAYSAGDTVPEGTQIYWEGGPVIPDGHVYVLGDNPDVSLDSRSEDLGLIPHDEIWGTILWNLH